MNVKTEELFYKSATQLSAMLNSGEITSEQLTQTLIERTQATDSKIGSYLHTNPEYTLEQARASDQRRKEGRALSPLDGIPLSLKDNISETNQPLTCASKILENYRSPYDATVTRKLKEAGLVLWGRTNLDEFAMGSSTETSAFKDTGNPFDPSRTPGGSSGGSATCVSAGQAVFSLGSDTGGSIRQPASYCGIVGLKPTYGLVSRYGLAAFASSLDQIGPFTRCVEDAAHILEVIAGHDPFDSTSYKVDIPQYSQLIHQKKDSYTLGIPKEYFGEGLSDEVRQAVEKAIKFYESQGCKIVEVSLPHTELAVPTYYVIAPAEASSNLARYDGIRYTHRAQGAKDAIDIFKKTREEGFGDEVKRRIMLGTFVLSSGYYDAYYSRAQKVRTLIRKDFTDAFDSGVDAIITPTTPDTAFVKGEKTGDPLAMYLEDIFTISVNLAGLPGISIPCGFGDNGMPIGLQIIGKTYQEAEMLSIAHLYESGNDFLNQHPKL